MTAIGAHHSRREAGFPALAALGPELLAASVFQRVFWPLVPLLAMGGFWAAYSAGGWHLLWLPLAMLVHFVSAVSFTHDLVHGAAGVNRAWTERLLFLMSLLLLESVHAFRLTHLHHHSHLMEDDDFEGRPARLTLCQVLLSGPTYIPRLWLRARRQSHSARERRWLNAELVAVLGVLGGAVALLPWSGAPLAFVTLVWLGSWTYPLTASWLPHFNPGETALLQSRTLRGRFIPALLLNLTYHLEHHLYPQVPSCNLPLLARRLDPHLSARGLVPLHVF